MNAFEFGRTGKMLLLAAVACAAPSGTVRGQGTATKLAEAKRPAIYDEAADAKTQIAAALARARKDNKRVLLQFGGNWCGWCHKLHELFKADKAIARLLLCEYETVLVDVGHSDKNMDLVAGYGADLAKGGVPYLTVLDAEGKALVNQETGPLERPPEKGPAHDPEKVKAFLAKWAAAPLEAEKVLADGLARAGREQKMVFLHFGAPW